MTAAAKERRQSPYHLNRGSRVGRNTGDGPWARPFYSTWRKRCVQLSTEQLDPAEERSVFRSSQDTVGCERDLLVSIPCVGECVIGFVSQPATQLMTRACNYSHKYTAGSIPHTKILMDQQPKHRARSAPHVNS